MFYSYEQSKKYSEMFQRALTLALDSKEARDYLEQRRISQKTIEDFSIGWCPVNKKTETGVIKRFRGRVIFPVKNEYGDVIAFSGRAVQEENKPKWTHEYGFLSKSFFLYGFNIAYPEIIKKDYVILVEGQIDLIQMHEFGFKNTIGLMGCSLTEQHISKLFRYTRNFLLLLDGDDEGIEAAKKIEESLNGYIFPNLETGKDEKVLTANIRLRNKDEIYDPDKYLCKYGGKKLLKRINKEALKFKRGE